MKRPRSRRLPAHTQASRPGPMCLPESVGFICTPGCSMHAGRSRPTHRPRAGMQVVCQRRTYPPCSQSGISTGTPTLVYRRLSRLVYRRLSSDRPAIESPREQLEKTDWSVTRIPTRALVPSGRLPSPPPPISKVECRLLAAEGRCGRSADWQASADLPAIQHD